MTDDKIKKTEYKDIEETSFASFLSKEDFSALSELREELNETYENRQIWRTETEMAISVLNDVKFPTKASKYWQAVKEQSVFFENLMALSFDYKRILIEIRRIENKMLEAEDLDREELAVDLEEARFKKRNMELAAKDRMREIKIWSDFKDKLDDGSFDTKDVNNHQLVSYTIRFINQAISAGTSGSPAEIANLKGQLLTALEKCNEKGVVDQVLNELEPPVLNLLQDVGAITELIYDESDQNIH